MSQERSQLEVEGAIAEFGRVLEDLHTAHAELSARAARMEQELEAKVAELEAILHNLPTGVVVRDAQGNVLRANPVAERLLADMTELDSLSADGSLNRIDGREVTLRRSDVTLPDGRSTGQVDILDDRTEFVQMTNKMHEQAKMAGLGTVAGGIAHEVRNPLNAVRGFASLIAGNMVEGSTEARWARLIEEGVDECDAIIGAVLAFAAPERLCLEQLDARSIAESAIGLCRRELEREGRLESFDLSHSIDEDWTFDGDRIQLRQALRNLIANAVNAQTEGGLVHIAATRGQDTIEFRVHDAGPGIAPELVDRIADPFFTTRAEGSGLGLSLVHSIARLHGGSLRVLPDAGPLGGADMRLTLPLHAASAVIPQNPVSQSA